jgi:hypothetical protein
MSTTVPRRLSPVARLTGGHYPGAVDAVLRGAAVPYGYTLTVWASGEVMIDKLGKPGVGSVFGVVVAAAAAFGLLRLVSRDAGPTVDASELAAGCDALRTGIVHVATMVAAVGAVALLALIGTWLVWPLGAFTATVVYMGGTSVAMAIRAATSSPSSPSESRTR